MTQTASVGQDSQNPSGEDEDNRCCEIKIADLACFSDVPLKSDELLQTNGHGGENTEDGEPPSKRRRVSESAPNPRKKLESPPWKKALAEGPSSFTQDGVRKSGRTNRYLSNYNLNPTSGRQEVLYKSCTPRASMEPQTGTIHYKQETFHL
jgi:hypothetical protein